MNGDDNLAFESNVRPNSTILYRLESVRDFKGLDVRHIRWFTTEEAAVTHKAWIEDGRGKVISLRRFREESIDEMIENEATAKEEVSE